MQYIFILGRNRELSHAEILSYLNKEKIKYSLADNAEDFLILEIDKLDAIETLNNLGGTIKIGKILNTFQDINEINEKGLITYLENFDKKVFFGFSLYGFKNNIKKQIEILGLKIKKGLKQQKISSRLVISKEEILSSVIVKKNKLLTHGKEFLILSGKKIYLGETLAVQKFEEYSERDYGRPARDSLSGMLPPKLAKIMINLGQVKKDEILLDPFCGSGTILSEAMLLSIENLIGADISKKAIEDSQQNLDWMTEKYKLQTIDYKLQKLDVKNLSQKVENNSINKIITEPYLGPPLKGKETREKIQEIIAEISKIYLVAFKEFKKVLKNKGLAVVVFPIFKYNDELLKLNIKNEIKKLGFKEKIILENKKLIYSRPDQKVMREIVVWEK